jgi:FdrA protein
MVTKNIIKENTYLDSIVLMSMSGQLKELEGVEEVSLIMGSDANKGILQSINLLTPEGADAKPSDLIVALRTRDEKTAGRLLEKAEQLLSKRTSEKESLQTGRPKSYSDALEMMPDANLAVISLPGQYAGREAMAVLESGRTVMIFSDNVPLEEEIRLKKRASELGLLVMGPDCGTAIINGTALGFANAVRKGPFGIVGASGTGIQEVSTQLHKRGYGITQAIGVGGRDLSVEVRGMSMIQGIHALEKDTETKIIILISKPPSPVVASRVFDTIKTLKKKYLVNFLNGDPAEAKRRHLPFAAGLEEAAELAIAVHERRDFSPKSFSGNEEEVLSRARRDRKKIGSGRCLRGLFSGGTLADEAILILSREIGNIYSNIPLKKDFALENNWKSQKHTIVDLGEDEFTRGRPHPMIDYSIRNDRILQESKDPDCGVILLDVF